MMSSLFSVEYVPFLSLFFGTVSFQILCQFVLLSCRIYFDILVVILLSDICFTNVFSQSQCFCFYFKQQKNLTLIKFNVSLFFIIYYFGVLSYKYNCFNRYSAILVVCLFLKELCVLRDLPITSVFDCI